MKIQSVLGLCLSGCLLLAGTATMADNDNEKSNNRSARAVQVHIDKATGKKTSPTDSDEELSTVATGTPAAAPIVAADATAIMPLENQLPVQNEDGSVSARLGVKSMKFMTMKIGEDGEKIVTHETIEDFSNKTEMKPAEKGLE